MKTVHLKRYPVIKGDKLLAWNAADELLVDHLNNLDLDQKRILVLNDTFGAISSNIESENITYYCDSYIGHKAAALNVDMPIRFVNKLHEIDGIFDIIILKIPKNYSFLEDILACISSHLNENSKLIACSMIKHLGSGSFDLINKYFGDTTTSLAKKKARLIFADFQRKAVSTPYPLKVNVDGLDFPLSNHSNVFSREKLDIGTRFFLEHIPKGVTGSILDLGCGNGIIGLKAKALNPKSAIVFCDDSQMALMSAAENFSHVSETDSEFIWSNCFEPDRVEGFQLVLCNPPFHQGHTIGDFIAKQMFLDAKRVLNPGGALRIIGNSHLGYHVSLKKIFGNALKIAENKKFAIWESFKQRV